MLRLDLDAQDRLVLELPRGDLRVDRLLRAINLAFIVVERAERVIVLDAASDIVEAADYLRSISIEAGLSISLGPRLEQISVEQAAEIDQLSTARSGDSLAATLQPVPLFRHDIELLPHQIRSVEKALRAGNFADFSVQGAGKTMSALAIFANWFETEVVEKLLVIGPVSSFQPWEEEIARCFSETPEVLRWTGSALKRTQMVPAFRRSKVVLCSYDTARRDVSMLREQLKASSTALVLDESHYIKNFDIGARGAAMLELAPFAKRRLILSGTPAPHSLLDLYPQFAFLWPKAREELVGTPQEYLNRLTRSRAPAREIRETLTPFFHRTSQAELGLTTPETHTVKIPPNDVPPGQARIIKLLENRFAVEARDLAVRMDQDLLRQWRKARVIRLLQAASNPALLMSAEELPHDPRAAFDVSELSDTVAQFRDGTAMSAKLEWSIQKTRTLIDDGRKVLLWSWWVKNIQFLAEFLQEFDPLLLYGQIKPYEDFDDPADVSRERNIREFNQRDDRPLLIANPSACAESISLHRVCHDAIYVDRTYNCGQFLQSLNRIHRIGLPEDAVTNYWIPIVDCAVERSVDRRLQARQHTMFEFLGDETPVLGADWDEDSIAADSTDEMDAAYGDLLTEITR